MQTELFKAPGAISAGSLAVAGDATLNKAITVKGLLTAKNDFRGAFLVPAGGRAACPAWLMRDLELLKAVSDGTQPCAHALLGIAWPVAQRADLFNLAPFPVQPPRP